MIIRIKNLRLRAIIGVNDWERKEKQAVIVNAELEFDGSAAVASDNLADTIDYRTISSRLIEFTEGSEYLLIEALAGICSRCALKTRVCIVRESKLITECHTFFRLYFR